MVGLSEKHTRDVDRNPLIQSLFAACALIALAASVARAQNFQDDPVTRGAVWVEAAQHQALRPTSSADIGKASALTAYAVAVFKPTEGAASLDRQLQFGASVIEDTLFPKNKDLGDVVGQSLPSINAYGIRISPQPLFDLAGNVADAAAQSTAVRRELNGTVYNSALNSRELFLKAYTLSIKYPQTFGRAYNNALAPKYLSVRTDTPVNTVLAMYPALKRYLPAEPPGDSRNKALRIISDTRIKSLEDQLRSQVRAIHDGNFSSTPPTTTVPMVAEQRQARITQITADYEDEQAATSIISNLLILTRDPQLAKSGHDFAVLANQMAAVMRGIELYGQGAVSGVGLVATMLVAVVSIVDLGSDHTSPEIAHLRFLEQQIAQLRREMHERFDTIDRQLDLLMGAIERNYRAIAQVDADVRSIRYELTQEAATLNRISSRTALGIEALSQEGLKLSSAKCLDHARTFNDPMTFSAYADCLLTYTTLATDLASNEIYQPVASRSLEDFRLSKELELAPEKNLLYIDRYLSQTQSSYWHGHENLVNPTAWRAGVEGFIQLANQWPEFFYTRTKPLEKIHAMIVNGVNLERFAADLTGHTLLERKAILRDSLLENYRSKLDTVLLTINRSRETFYLNKAIGSGTSSHRPKLTSIPNCPGFSYNTQRGWGLTSPVAMSPVNDLTSVVPEFYRELEERGFGDLSACYSDARTSSDGAPPDVNGRVSVDIDIVVTLGGTELFRSTLREKEFLGKLQPLFENQLYWTRTFENAFRKTLAAELSSDTVKTIALNFAKAKLRADDDVESECSRTIEKDLSLLDTPLYKSAEELSGAKRLLDAVIAIGMPATHAGRDDLRFYLGPEGLPDRDLLTQLYGCFNGRDGNCVGELAAARTCMLRMNIESVLLPRLYEAGDVLDDVISTGNLVQVSPTVEIAIAKLRTLAALWSIQQRGCRGNTSDSFCIH